MRKRSNFWLAAAQIAALAGCVPTAMAPTVVVTPGPGKSFAAFAADQTGCRAQVSQRLAPVIQAANNQLVGNALLGVTPAQTAQSAQTAQVTLQQQYDIAYSQCMYAKGDVVPGFASPVVAEPEPESAPVQHHKRYVKKKPAPTTASSNFVQPAPATTSASFVQPAPAAPAGTNTGFAVPPPAAH